MEQHKFEARCPICTKFLTEPTLNIEKGDLSEQEFMRMRSKMRISYGSETMCRRCKQIRATVMIAREQNQI